MSECLCIFKILKTRAHFTAKEYIFLNQINVIGYTLLNKMNELNDNNKTFNKGIF